MNHKSIFGEPSKGIHSYKLFNIAIIDVLFTFIAAFLFSFYFKINYFFILVLLFLFGIVLHRLFNVKTTVDKFLFH